MEASHWLEPTLPFLGVTWPQLDPPHQPSTTLTRHSVDELVRLLVRTEQRGEKEHKIYSVYYYDTENMNIFKTENYLTMEGVMAFV